ncbi:hypothetical protein Uis1B_2071 [Bifidobacterium margollesii]|uniref:Phage protein n=1 Tax=Bifidobacterium margollesii TaxID=2020964 RepID=A0A2N5J7B2_9BIFI|nr:hypothetical protein [Bifidobacterium margollesii]PLS30099.1 hypothetical protein Uis1B_2071 [Bifidobacterium margollesii]
MERIDVYRGETVDDADGNRVQGPLTLVSSFDGLVAPITAGESPTDTSHGVTVGCTLYIRADGPTGILDTDVIGVRGRLLPVDGPVASWRDPKGRHIGDVITVRLKEG